MTGSGVECGRDARRLKTYRRLDIEARRFAQHPHPTLEKFPSQLDHHSEVIASCRLKSLPIANCRLPIEELKPRKAPEMANQQSAIGNILMSSIATLFGMNQCID
jgi:hypothetical protein